MRPVNRCWRVKHRPSGHRAQLCLSPGPWWHDDQVPVYRDCAVVLRVHKLGEADRIVTLLTRREGKVRAVAKGVRRTKSKFGGRLEPFSHVDLQLYAGRNLDIVTQAVTLDSFGSVLAGDYSRYTCATAIVETAERMTSEEREPTLRLYLLVVSALRALSETERDPSLVLDAFLLRAMALAGWAPALTQCARCGSPGPHAAFHVASGGLLCPQCRRAGAMGAARPAPGSIGLMAALAGGDWDAAQAAAPAARREASGLVAALLQWHLERALRSLGMVDRGTVQATPPVAIPSVDDPPVDISAEEHIVAEYLPADDVLADRAAHS